MFLFNESFGNVNIFLIWMKRWHLRNVCKAQIQGAGSSAGQAGLELSQWKHVFNSVRMLLPLLDSLFFFLIKWNTFSFCPPGWLIFFYEVKQIHWNQLEEGRWNWLTTHILAEQVQILLCFYMLFISTVPVCSGELRWDMKEGNAAVCYLPSPSLCLMKSWKISPLISARKGRLGTIGPWRFNSS